MNNFKQYIGQTKESVTSAFAGSGWTIQVDLVDGPPKLLTCDVNPRRLTLIVDRVGIVTDIQVG